MEGIAVGIAWIERGLLCDKIARRACPDQRAKRQ
jgi:hypothetical protein